LAPKGVEHEVKNYLPFCLAVSVLTVGTVALAPGASENVEQRLLASLISNNSIAKTEYVTVELEMDINKSAEQAWAKVGEFCDITDWMGLPCEYIQDASYLDMRCLESCRPGS
jgi:sensor domain CHASE-containing protein|tara:strand:- start:5361 stop:5699 length:339 start_codon:yes stop_codon:yes gene_type:complete